MLECTGIRLFKLDRPGTVQDLPLPALCLVPGSPAGPLCLRLCDGGNDGGTRGTEQLGFSKLECARHQSSVSALRRALAGVSW